jgi:formylglycine-generating enzyme required for sulfatase activity
MKKTALPLAALIAAFAALSLTTATADIGYQFVTVGNPGNANDTAGYGGVGAVSYTYDIGTYDVTLSQYTTFLNAVAQTDTYGLYNPGMATSGNYSGQSTGAGISQTGSSGSYVYSVIGGGNNPVTFVSWFDAARMANWMNNGQPTGLGEAAGSTEQGAYTLNGITSGGLNISKNANATYWIPSDNEWYKSAYYDPSLNGGVGGYWAYPTRSNSAPGNAVGGGTNQANSINGSVYSATQSGSYSATQNYLTNVGAFTNSASAYGTYDQGGNAFQWNDTVISGSSRGLRGGAWDGSALDLRSSVQAGFNPTVEGADVSFRLATVPEPSTVVSLIVGFGILAWKRKKLLGHSLSITKTNTNKAKTI